MWSLGAVEIARQAAVEAGDREMVEELIAAATNQALEKARQAAAEQMSKVAGDLEIPGIGDALARFGGLDGTPSGE